MIKIVANSTSFVVSYLYDHGFPYGVYLSLWLHSNPIINMTVDGFIHSQLVIYDLVT